MSGGALRAIVGAIVTLICCAAASEAPAHGADLAAATQAYKQNVKLGELLAGKPASAEQVAEAERLFNTALAGARSAVCETPDSAEAHHLLGMVLCTGYRPVSMNQGSRAIGATKAPRAVLLRGAAAECGEGVAELRRATELADSTADYVLDCASGMLTCGDAKSAQEQATSLWERKASLSKQEALRCAWLLADCARAVNTPEVETRWLQEVLKLSPKDRTAVERGAKIAAAARGSGSLTWQDYEKGMALARQANKPALIDFGATWCGWCKKLEKEVFPSPNFISAAQRFVCIKVDADARPDLTKKYRVNGYPTAVVVDASGRELRRIVGYRPTAEYVDELRKALPSG
ncbi:MAG: thioredoxin family protein [Armatimonadota bacterium]